MAKIMVDKNWNEQHFRIGFRLVPPNTVLIKTGLDGKIRYVGPGFHFVFSKCYEKEIDLYKIKEDKYRIDTEGNQDVYFDFDISYTVPVTTTKEMLEEVEKDSEVIKSTNKYKHRDITIFNDLMSQYFISEKALKDERLSGKSGPVFDIIHSVTREFFSEYNYIIIKNMQHNNKYIKKIMREDFQHQKEKYEIERQDLVERIKEVSGIDSEQEKTLNEMLNNLDKNHMELIHDYDLKFEKLTDDDECIGKKWENEIKDRCAKKFGIIIKNLTINMKQSDKTNEVADQIKKEKQLTILKGIQKKNVEIDSQAAAEAIKIRGLAENEVLRDRGKVEAKNEYDRVSAKRNGFDGMNENQIASVNGNKVIRLDMGSTFDIPEQDVAYDGRKTTKLDRRTVEFIKNMKKNINSIINNQSTTMENEASNFAKKEPVQETETFENTVSEEPVQEAEIFENTVPVEPVQEAEPVETPNIQEPIEPEIDPSIFEDVQSKENNNNDVINLPSQEILGLEVSKIMAQDEEENKFSNVFNDNEIQTENVEETTSNEELFDDNPIDTLEEENNKPSLSDSQIEELTYSNEDENAIPDSHVFFDDLEKNSVEEKSDENVEVKDDEIEEVNDGKIEEENTKNVDDIDILKSMKSELRSILENSDVKDIKAEEPIVSTQPTNLENTLPDISLPEVNEEPKVEEKPKGLNLDFINSTWGRNN